MIRTALVFPGQGSQFVEMGRALCREFPAARDAFAEASEATKLDLAQLCFYGPADQLALTEYTQPAVLTVSVAAYRVLRQELEFTPALAAGHSLGEYSALTAAGVIALPDAAQAVRLRGKWMQEAVPPGEGGMAAVMGLSREAIAAACREANGNGRNGQVAPANDNAPDQVVISGHLRALDRALALIKERGGKARKLRVSAPFHTDLMEPAAVLMAELLSGLAFSPFAFPVIANIDAEPYPAPEAVPDRLVRQITGAVRWRETVEKIDASGTHLYVEVGPGTVLAGLIRKTLPSPLVLPMVEPQHLKEIKEELSHGPR